MSHYPNHFIHSLYMSTALFDTRFLDPIGSVRCFCFPYGGGGPQSFSSWPKLLSPLIDICPISMPGRGVRFNEPPYTDFTQLLNDLSTFIVHHLARKNVFF